MLASSQSEAIDHNNAGPADFYYLRTPNFSFQQLQALLNKNDLSTWTQVPWLGEAIFLASPNFYTHLQANPPLTDSKLRQALLKYWLRMGSRSTPFGLFAGCSLGQLGTTTSFNVSDRQPICHLRLDTAILWELIRQLNQDPSLQPFLQFRPNTSLYPVGNHIRYLERDDAHTPPRYFTSQISINRVIRLVLRKATSGATIDVLRKAIVRLGYPVEEANGLLEQLIQDQVLVSTLSIAVTGPDCLISIIEQLKQIPTANNIVAHLLKIHSLLISDTSIQEKHGKVKSLFQQQLALKLPDTPLFQGDTIFSGSGHQLSRPTIRKLRQTLEKLIPLQALQPVSSPLKSFKERFYARYEEQEIPLAVALDEQMGIGYATAAVPGEAAFIHDLLASMSSSESAEAQFPLSSKADVWLHQLYSSWIDSQQPILELTDLNLAALADVQTSQPLPDSYYTLGYFLAPSASAIDAGKFQFRCKVMAGPSAFPLLGRFSSADKHLCEKLQTAFSALQTDNSDRIQAEIVHLPQPSIGNILQRPHLSDYEIPYLGHSTLPIERQIALDDLLISIPRGERVILRSRRLGKEVVPRLTSAHNYRTGLPVYQFLCDVQQEQGALAIQWHWGRLNQYRCLPRVQYKHIILQEARWRLDWTDYRPDQSEADNIHQWRQQWKWPRFIALTQVDQELFLDLENVDCQQVLISTLRRITTLSLIEWLQTPDQCCVEGPGGKLTHEIILPFLNESKSVAPSSNLIKGAIQRTFVPGTEWLYLKIYCGPSTASQILQQLGKLARSLTRSGTITHWFFLRYEDPEPHLRIRFHLRSAIQNANVLLTCQQKLHFQVNTGEISRIQVDTYQRELERYGEDQIELTEWLFWADSDAVLSTYQHQLDERTQLGIALLGIDTYLTDMGFSIQDKKSFCQQNFTAFFTEHSATAHTRKLLAQRYRENQEWVEDLFTPKSQSIEWQAYQQIFQKRSQRMKPHFNALLTNQKVSASYLSSLLHMFLNRLFEHHQRTYELLVYHHLTRFYQSQLAKPV
ncbi:hypothetical protein GCM10028805_61780 [Spirosoma harenae]